MLAGWHLIAARAGPAKTKGKAQGKTIGKPPRRIILDGVAYVLWRAGV